MLLYSYYDSDTGIRITESIEYKEEEIEKSRKKFKELKDEGIIYLETLKIQNGF